MMDRAARPIIAVGLPTTGTNLSRSFVTLFLRVVAPGLLVSACAGPGHPGPATELPERGTISLPLLKGWHDGRVVHYVTTDVSDREAAKKAGANFVPRLAAALVTPSGGRPVESAVERVYAVTNFTQGSVFPSTPLPVGPANSDTNYSPLWQVVEVRWQAGSVPRLLVSEEQVLQAQERGEVRIEKTDIVANCPIIRFADGRLPGSTIAAHSDPD